MTDQVRITAQMVADEIKKRAQVIREKEKELEVREASVTERERRVSYREENVTRREKIIYGKSNAGS